MNILIAILLQQAQGGGWSGILMIVAMIAIFYFVMIRPQSKRQKDLKKQRDAMKKGDRVVSAGGIHGKIRSVEVDTAIVEVSDGVTIKFDKGSLFLVSDESKEEALKK